MVISTREYETIYNYTKSRTPKTTVSPRYPKWGPTGLVGWGPIVTQSVPLGLNIPETKNKLEPTPYPVNSPETKAQFSPRFSYDILSGTQLGLLGGAQSGPTPYPMKIPEAQAQFRPHVHTISNVGPNYWAC